MFTGKLSSRHLLTALIAGFLLHNAEETFAMYYQPVQSQFAFVKPMDFRQFLFAVSLLSFAGIMAFAFAMLTKNRNTALLISTALASVILFNVFVPHVFVAIYTLHYTPGIITATLLNLPVSLMLLKKNRPCYPNPRQLLRQVLIGLAAGYALFAITLLAAKTLI